MRIMALDVGEATLGVAISDELGITAQPITTLERRGIKRDLRAIVELVSRHEIGTIVVGLPLRLSGVIGTSATAALEFADCVRARVNLPVIAWDERYSTMQAERVLLEGDASRSKRREVINQIAAAIILQSYLDSRPRMAP